MIRCDIISYNYTKWDRIDIDIIIDNDDNILVNDIFDILLDKKIIDNIDYNIYYDNNKIYDEKIKINNKNNIILVSKINNKCSCNNIM